MGYPPPPRAPIQQLDVSDPGTFERWCAAPAHDTRTLEEFAADGGYPVFPPNRDVREGRLPTPPRGGTGERASAGARMGPPL